MIIFDTHRKLNYLLSNLKEFLTRFDFYVPTDCLSNEFECNDGNCIHRTKICDGFIDCFSAEDEDVDTAGCLLNSHSPIMDVFKRN